MTTVQVDYELKNRLTLGGKPVVVCDEQGRRIGLFLPDETNEQLYQRARAAFSDEEIRAAEQEEGGFTWKEIHEELERRWPST